MPEAPNPKLRDVPLPERPTRLASSPYAELDVKSNFSFLRGASHPDELVYRAAELGHRAIAVTDFNSLAGVVRAHQAAKESNLHLLIGSRLVFGDAPDLLVWAPDRAAYARLCRLLTLGKRRTQKGECALYLEDFLAESEGLLAAMVMGGEEKHEGTEARRHEGEDARHEGTTARRHEVQNAPSPGTPGEGRVRVAPRCCSSHQTPHLANPHPNPLPAYRARVNEEAAFSSSTSCLRASVPSCLSLLKSTLGDRLSLAVSCAYGSDDATHLSQADRFSRRFGVPLLATNDVYYHDPARRPLQDVLTCIRHGCTIRQAGYRLFANGERYLKSPEQMYQLFADFPKALRRSVEIAERCAFKLDELRYEYPDELNVPGKTAIEHLTQLTSAGAAARYPNGTPEKVRRQIEHELKLIEQLRFEHYFLTVHDLVVFARSRGILCQGRGSAANSAVCYCLGVTSVDPDRIDVLFERFISAARGEPPDIDIDFEHERREEVLQYLYNKYSRERCALTAVVITYRGRSAVRDVGKAIGLSLDMVDSLAGKLDWWHKGVVDDEQIRDCGLDPSDSAIRQTMTLATEILGFPRHLSQHVGGMVMTRGPLCEMVPIENAAMDDRTVIEWDKDDIDAVGILKVDVLALGMLTCIAKAFDLIGKTRGGNSPSPGTPGEGWGEGLPSGQSESKQSILTEPSPYPLPDYRERGIEEAAPSSSSSVPQPLELHTIPPEDPVVYDMISSADTIGVFQIESRAQMSMLPRLRPRCFYDLVIEVAIVRPGPIQGDMVHPYLRRRAGLEPIVFPSEALRNVLEKTLGVPLFQEQAMRVAMVGAGFTAEEADKLRRVMAAWRRTGAIETFHQKIVDGMLKNGYTLEFAEKCFNQIKGFGEYGFPESHAASFALLVYVSAWLKCHHPAAFAAALINSQPMGFYMPAQIVRDAKDHGVEVREVDVNGSEWGCTLEERHEGTEARRHEVQNSPSPGTPGEGWGEGLPCEDSGGKHSILTQPSPCPLPDYRERVNEEVASASSPSCLRASVPSCLSSPSPSLRLGFRQLKGFRQEFAERIVAARADGLFMSIEQFHRRTLLPAAAIRILAEADAFGSLGLSRRQAYWQAIRIKDQRDPLFDRAETLEPAVRLPVMPEQQEIMTDYATAGLSLKRHPLALLRDELRRRKVITSAELMTLEHNRWVKVAGLVLIRQRPSTASGVVFETLEDETGIVNLIVHPAIYDKYRPAARHAGLLQAEGYIQRQGQVVHVLAKRLTDLSLMLEGYDQRSRDFH